MDQILSPNGRRPLKILHTSDVHLGYDLSPGSAWRGFQAMLSCAHRERVDLLIIAGDLFDGRRAAFANFDWAFEELGRLPMPVVLLPGNHDPYDDGSVYLLKGPTLRERYAHLHLICDPDGELLRFPELDLTVWGRPVIDHTPAFRPLETIPERQDGGWHIAVAHGLHVEDPRRTIYSSLIPEASVIAAGWDYLALGHVHGYRDLSRDGVVACYSGSPGALYSEPSEGGVALVELDPVTGVAVRRLQLIEPMAGP